MVVLVDDMIEEKNKDLNWESSVEVRSKVDENNVIYRSHILYVSFRKHLGRGVGPPGKVR